MKDRPTVLIVDDHPATRVGIATLLADAGLTVVGQAAGGEEALDKATKLKPDVVLLDVLMRDQDGFWALERIRERLPGQRVIMLSAFGHPSYLARSLNLKANDYLLKDAPPAAIVAAIHRVFRDEPLPEQSILRQIRRPATYRKRNDNNPLTDREIQVLCHVSQGLSNTEIGKALGISVETVKEHVQNIIRKLDVDDRTQAAVWAVRAGMV
jgi:DNA-binding NarL/FixJ family response regulator